MIQRIGRKKHKIFAFDIESHNDSKSVKKRVTSMWLGCFIDESSKATESRSYIYTMDELFKRLEEESSEKRKHGKNRPIKNVCVYVYNFSFEFSFMMPYLEKYGFKYQEIIDDNDEYAFNTVCTKSVSSVWLLQMKFHKDSGIIIFRDLAKIYGGGLANVAKAFNLPTQKGSINYRKNRIKRKGYRISAKEKIYCFKDTKIIVDILEKLADDKDFWNVTSMASYSMKKLLRKGYPRATKPYEKYRQDYPELDAEESSFLREAVSGGITYAPSRWQFKDIEYPILHIDYHQMHPSQGYEHYFPYGKGEYFKGRPMNFTRINCCRIRISYDYVRLHSVISLIGIDAIDDRIITVWDFEIPTMYKAYVNLTIEYIDGYSYQAKRLPWRNYYKDNYLLRLEAKKRKDSFYTLQYKLLNNSSYGKHLEKPHNDVFMNYVRNDGIIDSLVSHKEKPVTNAKYTYLPVGGCIPAYSRVDLIETAFKFDWKDVVYFDTDSIFVLATPHNMEVWKTLPQEDFLGNWGFEEMIDRALFAAPKRYKTYTDGITTIKMAGINGFENAVPYDEVNIISSDWRVQRAYRCKGGTVIDMQPKKVSVQPKYEEIFKANTDLKYSQIKLLSIALNKLLC